MPNLSVSQLSAFTGRDRRTVTAKLASLDFQEGPDNAHLYDSVEALAAIYSAGAKGSALDEAKRDQAQTAADLNRARKEDLDRKRIPIGIPIVANDQALQSVGALLKASRNKKLTPGLINTLLEKLRAIPAQLDVAQWK